MADKKAVASGNWSSTATWDGGTLPASTDDVYANNFTVNIDQSITVNRLRTTAGTGITAGGKFEFTSAADITITAGVAPTDFGTNGALMTLTAGSHAVSITAPTITAGATASSRRAIAAPTGYVGTLTIDADLSGNVGYALYAGDACTIVVNGDLLGYWNGCVYADGDGATLTITGNLSVAATDGYRALHTPADVTVTITGDIIGYGSQAAVHTGGFGADYTIRGNLRCGGFGGFAVQSDGSGTDAVRVSGALYAQGSHAGDDTTLPGLFPIFGTWCKIAGEDLSMHFLDDSDFPTSNLGDPVEYSGSGGGPTIPTSGVLWPPRYWG